MLFVLQVYLNKYLYTLLTRLSLGQVRSLQNILKILSDKQ